MLYIDHGKVLTINPVNVQQLQSILMDKIDEGFTFRKALFPLLLLFEVAVESLTNLYHSLTLYGLSPESKG